MKSFQLVFFHPRNSDHVIRIENEVSNGDMRSRRWRTEGRYEYVIMITIICPSHPSNRCYQYNIRMLIHHFIIIWKQRKRFRKWKVFRYLIAGNSKIVYLVSHKIFIWVKIIMNEAWTKQTRLVWIPWQRWHNFPLEAVHEVRIQQVVQNRIKWTSMWETVGARLLGKCASESQSSNHMFNSFVYIRFLLPVWSMEFSSVTLHLIYAHSNARRKLGQWDIINALNI